MSPSGFTSLAAALLFTIIAVVPVPAEEQQQTAAGIVPVTYHIGIVTDGPLAGNPDMPAVFRQEIERLAQGEFEVGFPEALQIRADSTRTGVSRGIDALLGDPEVDLVITLGTVGSTEALSRDSAAKPLIAPFIFDGDVQNAPQDGAGSGVRNLFYVNLGTPFDQEVSLFRRLVPFKTLGLIIDERDIRGIPEIEKLSRYLANEHSLTVHLVPSKDSAEQTIAAIPDDTEAVLVGPLWQMSRDEFDRFARLLIERRIAGFSISSYEYVEAGLFATTMPPNMVEQLARQVAISIQEILLGEQAGELPVAFSRSQSLSINMATARAIDIYPSLDYMTGANLINEQRRDIERRLNLAGAVAEAVTANLDLEVARREVLAGEYAVDEARSALLPQVAAGIGGRVIDDDRATLARGTNPERTVAGSLSGYQQLYSESGWAGYRVAQYTQSGREFDREQVKLDIIFETSVSYLNVLRQKTVEQLQKDNMALTKANLDRAQIRLSTGVAGPDEVYRWQTKFANDRQAVLQAESATLDAMQALNRILNRPLQEEFVVEEIDLQDPLVSVGDRLYRELIHHPGSFAAFRKKALEVGMEAAPELKIIDAAIGAQQRLLTKAQRDYWLPTFSLEAELEHKFATGGAGEPDEELTGLDDTDWLVGVFARLPLFAGGQKRAVHGRFAQQLIRLQTERRATEERIGQRILRTINDTRSSYPSINLSRDAVDAARRNLQLVTDSYVYGIKSIIDLLDAQNQALIAELDAANAVYNFLIDLMAVQRSISTFVTFLSPEEQEQWYVEMKTALEAGME